MFVRPDVVWRITATTRDGVDIWGGRLRRSVGCRRLEAKPQVI